MLIISKHHTVFHVQSARTSMIIREARDLDNCHWAEKIPKSFADPEFWV